jgi:hypothetical protein
MPKNDDSQLVNFSSSPFRIGKPVTAFAGCFTASACVKRRPHDCGPTFPLCPVRQAENPSWPALPSPLSRSACTLLSGEYELFRKLGISMVASSLFASYAEQFRVSVHIDQMTFSKIHWTFTSRS